MKKVKTRIHYYIAGCYGTSPKTGKGVGYRHRWPDGRQYGRCEFCGRVLAELLREEVIRD